MLALVVAAGVVDSSAVMKWLPVDLTVLAAVAVTVGAMNALAGVAWHRARMPIGWTLGAFAVGALGLVRWGGSDYARDKTLALFTLTLGCSFLGGLLLVWSPRQRDVLAWGTVGAGLLVAALPRLAPATGAALEGRVALAGAFFHIPIPNHRLAPLQTGVDLNESENAAQECRFLPGWCPMTRGLTNTPRARHR